MACSARALHKRPSARAEGKGLHNPGARNGRQCFKARKQTGRAIPSWPRPLCRCGAPAHTSAVVEQHRAVLRQEVAYRSKDLERTEGSLSENELLRIALAVYFVVQMKAGELAVPAAVRLEGLQGVHLGVGLRNPA